MSQPVDSTNVTRRKFVAAATTAVMATAATSAMGAPAIRTSKTIAAMNETVIGEGDFRFKADHSFCVLPDKYKWQTTHNVAVDSSNNLYVIHEGLAELKDHPSIFVFDAEGKFIRAFGSQFQGGGHGIEIRKEGSQEFLYVAAYQDIKSFAKLTLSGVIVWYKKAPMESGVYEDGEDTSVEATWSRLGFLPTTARISSTNSTKMPNGFAVLAAQEKTLGNSIWLTGCGSTVAKEKRQRST